MEETCAGCLVERSSHFSHSGKGICIVLRLYIFMQKDNFSSLRIVGCDNLYKKSIRERITRSSKIKLFFLADN